MLTQPDIDSVIERAERIQDGMTVNRDLFASDVKKLANELRNWRNCHANAQPNKPQTSEFDIFGDLFKK